MSNKAYVNQVLKGIEQYVNKSNVCIVNVLDFINAMDDLWVDDSTHKYVMGAYNEGEYEALTADNTYNYNGGISNDLHTEEVSVNGETYVIVEVHTVGDVRVGYYPVPLVYKGTFEDFLNDVSDTGASSASFTVEYKGNSFSVDSNAFSEHQSIYSHTDDKEFDSHYGIYSEKDFIEALDELDYTPRDETPEGIFAMKEESITEGSTNVNKAIQWYLKEYGYELDHIADGMITYFDLSLNQDDQDSVIVRKLSELKNDVRIALEDRIENSVRSFGSVRKDFYEELLDSLSGGYMEAVNKSGKKPYGQDPIRYMVSGPKDGSKFTVLDILTMEDVKEFDSRDAAQRHAGKLNKKLWSESQEGTPMKQLNEKVSGYEKPAALVDQAIEGFLSYKEKGLADAKIVTKVLTGLNATKIAISQLDRFHLMGGMNESLKESREDYSVEEIWDYLVESGIATEEELKLVTMINGYSEDSLNDVIYARTAYRSLSQLKEEDDDDEDMDMEDEEEIDDTDMYDESKAAVSEKTLNESKNDKQALIDYMLSDDDFRNLYYNVFKNYNGYKELVNDTADYVFGGDFNPYTDKKYLDVSWLEVSDGKLIDLDEVYDLFKGTVNEMKGEQHA